MNGSMPDHEMARRRSSSSNELNETGSMLDDDHVADDFRTDDRDMLRLGKKQEFKVRKFTGEFRILFLGGKSVSFF